MLQTRIYLDNNATTPILPQVREFFNTQLDFFGNASSLHDEGRIAKKSIEKARVQVADLIGAKPNEIIFTSGGSESNNTVFNTMITESKKRGKNTVITTQIEHPCVLESCKRLETFGINVIYLPVNTDGTVKEEDYKKALEQKPLLVSIMAANNEIGTIQNIEYLAKLAHDSGALFHTDAVQAAGKIPITNAAWNTDYATLSGHKIYSPKGVGALYVKKGAPIEPLIRGGHQENGLRAGTYNSPSIAAFGLAAEYAKKNTAEYAAHTQKLRIKLRDGLLAAIPNIRINGHKTNVLPNTLNVSFPGAEGEAILLYTDLLGIAVSTGSACASGSLEPSHVLLATGHGPETAHGSIRFSLGNHTTEQEIDYVLKELPPVIEKLRKMSTVSSLT